MTWLLISAALFVAFSNGANDNFKGFATVWGSATLNYRQALVLATIATVAGSLASLLLAEALAQQFSGKGLVPDAVANAPLFMLSVAVGAAVTVFLATRLGLPVSTTHALIGGLVGTGFAQSAGVVHLDRLASSFLLPLLISPVLAAGLGIGIYRLFRLAAPANDCACVVAPTQTSLSTADGAMINRFSAPSILVAPAATCDRLDTPALRVAVPRSMDRLHVLSAMSICFARAVNDTPKLAALLLAAHVLNMRASIAAISAVMALGGIIFARRVAETMSQRVTRLDHAQGLAANLITAILVLFASKLSLPVSTTHVAVGAIAGLGASSNTLNWQALRNILWSWLATMPLAACVAWSVSKII